MAEDPSFFLPPKPSNPLGYHRILSPTASVKVSPLALGGLSLGNSWSPTYGRNEEAEKLLDAYIGLGGNFLDLSNADHAEDSERLVGEWMRTRGVRDQMVVATKYTSGYKKYDRSNVPLQSNYAGNSAKSMHISVRDSLKKLATEYIDLLYVQWWDFATSVEEVMRHLHTFVVARQVLYLGVSNTPAWVVVKANMFARANALTPFSVYQGKWNAGFRDLEAEIVLMCEDQGMALVPWGVFGGGQLRTMEQREADRKAETARKPKFMSERHIQVSKVLKEIGQSHGTSLQAVALAYLLQQSAWTVPVVGVQTVEHVLAMPDALRIRLSDEELRRIYGASPLTPLFPMGYLFNFRSERPYYLDFTAADCQRDQMAAYIDAPPRQSVRRKPSKRAKSPGS